MATEGIFRFLVRAILNLQGITILLSVPLVPEEVFVNKVGLFSSIRGTFVFNLRCFDTCSCDFRKGNAGMC